MSPGGVARRSCLSVPGGDERKLAKVAGCGADEVVLDLEDAVAIAGKDAARAAVAAFLAAPPEGVPSLAVRVNAARSRWCHQDVQAVAAAGGPPRSIVLPKVESAADVGFVERLLDGVDAQFGRTEPVTIQALIESAAGLARVAEIAGSSPRLRTLILGYADLGASLGRGPGAPPEVWAPAQDAVLVAARAAWLAAIDGPHLGTLVDDDFQASVERARAVGFDGKWVIHPRQIGPVTTAFTPSSGEVAEARAVLDALDTAGRSGLGAVALDGRMLDEALAVAARRTLARAGQPAHR